MAIPDTFRIGCNIIDPDLEINCGEDYDVDVTRRSLEFLAELGFDAVEHSHCLHWSDSQVEAVRAATEEVGIGSWSLHAWVGGDVMQEEGARRTSDILRRAADIAVGLGALRIVHHPSGGSLAGDGMERLAREADILRDAWKPGFLFGIENLAGLAQMEYVIALVDELGPEIAGVNVDTGHANLSSDLGAGKALRMAGHRLVTTHLQDNHGTGDEHLPPGSGEIAWDDVAAALGEINYTGCLMLELTDILPPERRALGVRGEITRGADMARWLSERVPGACYRP